MEEQLTLFGATEGAKEIKRTTKKEVFEDYEAFVRKFEAKKTSDDCYTPPAVYDAILAFVRKTYNIGSERPIVRPFYPGGDYEAFEYPYDCVVVDNPPFSQLTKICRFYTLHRVPFFLFGPSLMLFSAATDCDLTYIIADAKIIYENGANVATGFITNLDKVNRIWCCSELREAILAASVVESKKKQQFIYPDNLVTAALLQKVAANGLDIAIPKGSCRYVKDSDSAKAAGRSIFGGGYLLSDKYAQRVREVFERAEARTKERAIENIAKRAAERAAATLLVLSPRERFMLEQLNKQEQ